VWPRAMRPLLSRVRRLPRRHRLATEINVINLTDVALVLLIIFLVTATSLVLHGGMDIRLPKASTARPEAVQAVNVTINSLGTIKVDGKVVAPEELASELMRRKRPGGPRVVRIRADEKAEYGLVIRALDAARQAGFSNVTLAVERALPGAPEFVP